MGMSTTTAVLLWMTTRRRPGVQLTEMGFAQNEKRGVDRLAICVLYRFCLGLSSGRQAVNTYGCQLTRHHATTFGLYPAAAREVRATAGIQTHKTAPLELERKEKHDSPVRTNYLSVKTH